MTQQTTVRERTIKTSIYGSGREHYHVILSKSRGLDRVIAVSTFDMWHQSADRARSVKAEYERMGFTTREMGHDTYLRISKDGETDSYLRATLCRMKHQIDG